MDPTRRKFIATAAGSAVALALGAHPLRSEPVRKRLIVDTHMIVWRSPTDSWRDLRGNPLPKQRHSFNVDVALHWMDEAGVDRAVLTPRTDDGNKFILEATKRHPDRFAAMGVVPLDDRRSKALLPSWREQPGMLGLSAVLPPEPDTIARMKSGTYDWFWAAAEQFALPVIVKTGPLMPLDPILERHPGLVLILEVLSYSHISLPHHVPRLVALAKYPNISVTWSRILHASRQHYPFRDITDSLRSVFDAYGPRRFYWGSGANHFRQWSLRQRISHYTEELGFLSEDDKDWVMGRAIMDRLKWS